jgi:hypothetical protein
LGETMSEINLGSMEASEISPQQQLLVETLKIRRGSPDKKIFWQNVAKIYGKKSVIGREPMSLMLHESLFGKANAELVEKQKKNIIA